MLPQLVVQEPREEARLLDLLDLDIVLQQLVEQEVAMEIELLVPPVVPSPMAHQVEEAGDTETQVVLTEVQEELAVRVQLCP